MAIVAGPLRFLVLLAITLLVASPWATVTSADDTPAATEEAAPAKTDAPAESAEEAAAPELPVLAFVGGRLHTMSDAGVIENGTIIVRGDKIEAVGKDIAIPENARVVDVAGQELTPGLVDLRGVLWLTSSAAGDTGSTAAMDALDGVDPFNGDWREVARQGVTSVYIQPAATGALGGFGSLLRVAPGDGTSDSLTQQKHAGFQSSLGVGVGSSRARLGQFDSLKKRFAEAKTYKEEWDKYRKYEEEQAKAKQSEPPKPETPAANPEATPPAEGTEGMRRGGFRGGRGGPPGSGFGGRGPRPGPPGETPAPTGNPPTPEKPGGDKPADEKPAGDKPAAGDGEKKPEGEASGEAKKEEPPKKPKFDALKENLVRVLNGELPLRMEVHSGDDAKRALDLAKEFGVTMVLEGLTATGSGTEAVVKSGLPIVLGPWSDDSRQGYQAEDRVENWVKQFGEYEGRMAIATFSTAGRSSRALRFEAARAVAAGLNAERALRAITSVPAELAGAGDHVGKLQAGYQADIAVFAGAPLDPSSPVALTMVAGHVTHEAGVTPQPTVGIHELEASPLPTALPASYAIRCQNILRSDGTFAAGTLVIREGKVAGVAAIDATVDGLPVYDAGSAVVTPGLVTAHANLTPNAFRDDQVLVDSTSIRAADVYDPKASAVRELVAGGFTRAGHAPGDQRVIAGPLAEVRLGAANSIVTPVIAEKFVLSGNARNNERFPASLAGQQQLVLEAFATEIEPLPLFLPKAALAVLDDARRARKEELTSGNRPTLIRAETEAEVLAALKLADTLKLKVTLLGPDELEATHPLLAKAQIGVVTRPMSSADYDWFATDLAAAIYGGVVVGFSGGDPWEIRRTAAALAQAGAPTDALLRGLTSSAATLVGMSPAAGQLAVDQPADFVIWTGSPLNLSARPLAVIIDGQHARETE